MPVNYLEKTAAQLADIAGVSLLVAQAGVKKPNHNDVTIITLEQGSTVGAVFTQNRFCAAPVHIAKQHLQQHHGIRALIINTGNANAGTGMKGRHDAEKMCAAVAAKLGCQINQVLPFSTGVILEPLPIDKITNAVAHATPADWHTAARAIMTTDTVAKATHRQIFIDDQTISATGIAKGAGMICPNMATMLGFIATDAHITQSVLQQLTQEVANASFNCITVDGDTSTNDSFVIIATGKAGLPEIKHPSDPRYAQLRDFLAQVALELAQAIVRDGEGATKFITIEVHGAASHDDAQQIAYAIAHSPLVKTAFFASDPNLGRILAAIGYAGVAVDTDQLRLYLDDVLVAEHGARAQNYTEQDGQRIMQQSEITIRVELNEGQAMGVIYTCDLSHEYVSINADYRS